MTAKLCLILAISSIVHAADIVLLHGDSVNPGEVRQIQAVADFYGLALRTIDTSKQEVGRAILGQNGPDTVAILISQDALPRLNRNSIRKISHRPGIAGLPIFVFGLRAEPKYTNDLKQWSGGLLKACAAVQREFRPKTIAVRGTAVSRTLAGSELPAVAVPSCKMQFEQTSGAQAVLTARGSDEEIATLLQIRTQTGEAFFAPQMEAADSSWKGNPSALSRAFSSMAHLLLFLDYAAGDYTWRLDGHYANLTIDDPWLTQPYGRLDYTALLVEMKRYSFHTTIAFIPWNYGRSRSDVAEIFRSQPQWYSVALHGNNHTHREFSKGQTGNIKQAIWRMERFNALTGISYDRFMIFPHAVAAEETFSELKRYNFLGTANSLNVPEGNSFPTDPVFLLRTFTRAYARFPSFARYSVDDTLAGQDIAIHSFLGNPLLFYGHEGMFRKGITAFNDKAAFVNGIQPDTRWTSLGEIARHLYLTRRRADGDIDAEVFSNEPDLTNTSNEHAVFHVILHDAASPTIDELTIDGRPATFERSNDMLEFHLAMAPHETRKVRIRYRNDLSTSLHNIDDRNPYASVLRLASDFRDLYLSRLPYGESISAAYYRFKGDSVELYLEQNWWILLPGLLVVYLSRRRLRMALWFHGRRRQPTLGPNQ